MKRREGVGDTYLAIFEEIFKTEEAQIIPKSLILLRVRKFVKEELSRGIESSISVCSSADALAGIYDPSHGHGGCISKSRWEIGSIIDADVVIVRDWPVQRVDVKILILARWV